MSSRQLASARHLHVVPDAGAETKPTPIVSDEALVAAVRAGDSEKAALLYDRLIAVVDGTLVRMLGRREQDHGDLVQSVFEQIVVALVRGRFHGECALSSWAGAVTCNFGLNVLRSRMRERRVVDRSRDAELEREQADAPGDVEQQIDARRALHRVRDVIAGMRHERATAVLLYDVFGYELTEIAAMTGVTKAAAQSRLVRGRKELHERLEEANETMVEKGWR